MVWWGALTVGGVWTVASFGLRVVNRAQREVFRGGREEKEYIPSTVPSPAPQSETRQGYFGSASRPLSRAASWAQGRETNSREALPDWRAR